MSTVRRLLLAGGLAGGLLVATTAGASPAGASEPLPSNCWWTWSDNLENLIGVAGYCVENDGSIDWFDFNGNYGAAWWMV